MGVHIRLPRTMSDEKNSAILGYVDRSKASADQAELASGRTSASLAKVQKNEDDIRGALDQLQRVLGEIEALPEAPGTAARRGRGGLHSSGRPTARGGAALVAGMPVDEVVASTNQLNALVFGWVPAATVVAPPRRVAKSQNPDNS
ncbi:hypothetical protein PPSIR1_06466 [Plesiocystis pacifica SIR-1]|uniref:Uncharacterized protein n=2 Tax=Plesiocystis pacifica TaxID=191768 RepID=A6GI03_9BACT|nr:hypothetical protein PPSIR1_06466 [Plesiocystis pacifica SIR-1]